MVGLCILKTLIDSPPTVSDHFKENANAIKEKVNCIPGPGLENILCPFFTSLQFYGWILCQPVSVRGENFNDKNVGTSN